MILAYRAVPVRFLFSLNEEKHTGIKLSQRFVHSEDKNNVKQSYVFQFTMKEHKNRISKITGKECAGD